MRDVFTIFVRIQGKLLLACLALLLLSNCSDRISSPSRSSFPVAVKLSYDTPKTLHLEYDNESDLRLVSTGTNLTLSVSSCSSGYSLSSTTITSGVINLYKGDRNCLVKLTGFTLGSVSYSPTGGTDFTTWLNNDVATFKNTSGSDTIKVYVTSQVTQSGVQTSDTVVYKFTDVAQNSTSTLSQLNTSTPVPLTVNGQPAPNFTVTQARYLSTNPNGSGNMSFTLECGNTLTGSSLPSYACDTALLNSQLDYILITDTYSQGNIIVSQANTAFASNSPTSVGSLIVTPGASDLNSNTLTKGGFYTSNASPLTTGTTPAYPSNLNYVFMLRQRDASGNTLSYLYFYVTVYSITQYPNGVNACGTVFAGGSGTVGDPYLVADKTTLQNTESCTSSSTYFKLSASIDLGGSSSPWTPIQLYGSLDGNNYTISNLYVNGGTNNNIGLFSIMNIGSSVSNLIISNATISATQSGGILAGQVNGGTITSVSTSGTLTSTMNTAGVTAVGGLVGSMNYGSATSSSSSANITFTPSSSTSSRTVKLGGLFGNVSSSSGAIGISSTITSSFATGNITIQGGTVNLTSLGPPNGFLFVGGFVGNYQRGTAGGLTITNSYARGSITQSSLINGGGSSVNSFLGGFVGKMWSGSISMSRCFSTGAVSTAANTNFQPFTGGFIGGIENATLSDSYSFGSPSLSSNNSIGGSLGGFLGQSGPGSTTSNLSRSYSAAQSVTGDGFSNVGGFIGAVVLGLTRTNNYYYNGPGIPSNSFSGVTGLNSISEIQTQSSYTGFDFSTPIWKMPSSNPLSPNGYLSPVHNWLCGTNGVVCP